MNYRRLYILLFVALSALPTLAQTWAQVKAQTEVYLYGEGSGNTIEEADQSALADLISKISVVVNRDFEHTIDETAVNGDLSSSINTKAKIETYTAATLTNTERVDIGSTEDEYFVGRYIRRTEVGRIFEGRIRTIKEYIRLGKAAEGKAKVDDALRYYYWAYLLLQSVQHPAEVSYDDEETGRRYQPQTWLPEQMNTILTDLEATLTKSGEAQVDAYFTYKGKPVASLDFKYFDGKSWSNLCSAKNGVGTMDFAAGLIPDNIQLSYEYAYRGQAHINPEVKSVVGVIKGRSLRKANVTIALSGEKSTVAAKATVTAVAAQTASSTTSSMAKVADETPYRTALNEVLAAIKAKHYEGARQCFTANGWDMFYSLVHYGKARIVGADACQLYAFRNKVVARSVQMAFAFERGLRRNFVEDVVFTFNADGLIDCVAFGLDEVAQCDILGKEVWPMDARQLLMEFLENYKTAYALKRLDYLKTIFDDNAVIIVGHIAQTLTTQKGDNGMTAKVHDAVRRTRYSKAEYMQRLEACFASNEFINIRFANNDVRKAMGGEEYGIQIKQDYYSTNYGDQGYLYLHVDLTNPDQPQIKVRTWQPEPDPDFGVYGMEHFK